MRWDTRVPQDEVWFEDDEGQVVGIVGNVDLGRPIEQVEADADLIRANGGDVATAVLPHRPLPPFTAYDEWTYADMLHSAVLGAEARQTMAALAGDLPDDIGTYPMDPWRMFLPPRTR